MAMSPMNVAPASKKNAVATRKFLKAIICPNMAVRVSTEKCRAETVNIIRSRNRGWDSRAGLESADDREILRVDDVLAFGREHVFDSVSIVVRYPAADELA